MPVKATWIAGEPYTHADQNEIATLINTVEANHVEIVGDGTTGPFVINHGLGTRHVKVVVYRNGDPWDEDLVRCEHTDNANITLRPDVIWPTDSRRVVVQFMAASDNTPPNAGTLAYSDHDATSITYTFSGQSDNVGVTRIDAYDADTDTLVDSDISSPYVRDELTPETEYGTFLRVWDGEGNSNDSNTVTRTTDASSDVTSPTAGTASLSTKDTDSITYTFTAGSDNVGVTQVDAHDGGGSLLQASVTSPWERSGLTAATEYSTFFRYYDAAGNNNDSNTVTTTTDALSGPVARVAGTGTTDLRTTPDTTPISAAPTFTVPDNGKTHSAAVWASVSHSTSNNPATYDTLTCSSNIDGAATSILALRNGPFGGQSQGAIILIEFEDISPGEHTLDLDIDKAGFSFTSLMVHVDVYENAASFGTPVQVEQNTAANISIAVPSVDTDNMAAFGLVATAAETFDNGTERYGNGGSVTGSGDFMYVRDIAGAGGTATLTGSSASYSGLGVEVIKAA